MTAHQIRGMAGSIVGGFTLTELLGGGQLWAVYRVQGATVAAGSTAQMTLYAVDEDAAKLLHTPDFAHQLKARKAFQHPGSVTDIAVALEPPFRYVVTPELRGKSLAERLIGRSPLMPLTMNAEIAALLLTVAVVLDAAHAAGLVHGNLTTHQLVFDAEGVAYVAGLGADALIARTLLKSLDTPASTQAASVDYGAPEILSGNGAQAASDQYSLAVIAFQLLSGGLPYDGATAQHIVMGHVQGPIPSLAAKRPDLAAEIDAVFKRALAKDPAERYATVRAFATELAGFLNRADVMAEPPETRQAKPANAPKLANPEDALDVVQGPPPLDGDNGMKPPEAVEPEKVGGQGTSPRPVFDFQEFWLLLLIMGAVLALVVVLVVAEVV